MIIATSMPEIYLFKVLCCIIDTLYPKVFNLNDTVSKDSNSMAGQQVGYIRISSYSQNHQRQLDGIELTKRFTDIASGKDTKRPQLNAMLDYVRDGDSIIVHSMDRLARNLDDLRGLVQQLTDKGVTVEFVKEGLTFTGEDSPMPKLLLSMMGAVAEFERALIKERQREGIEQAKKRGVYSRKRRKKLTQGQIDEIRQRVAKGDKKSQLAREFGLGRKTIYRYLESDK